MDTGGRIQQHLLSASELGKLSEAVAKVLPAHSWVQAAYLFGSAARSDRPARDVDLGLVGRPLPGWRTLPEIAAEILDRWDPAPLDLDLRLLTGASPVFLNQVLLEGRLVYEADREARLSFEVTAMSRWLDFRPIYERVREQVLTRWSNG